MFPLVQKVLKSTKKPRSYNRKHKWVFFSEHNVDLLYELRSHIVRNILSLRMSTGQRRRMRYMDGWNNWYGGRRWGNKHSDSNGRKTICLSDTCSSHDTILQTSARCACSRCTIHKIYFDSIRFDSIEYCV